MLTTQMDVGESSHYPVTGVQIIPNKMRKKVKSVEVFACDSYNIYNCLQTERVQKCRFSGRSPPEGYGCSFDKGAISGKQYFVAVTRPAVEVVVEVIAAGGDQGNDAASLDLTDGCYDKVVTGKLLDNGDSIAHGAAKAIMQQDGNFVLFHGDKAVWSTKTSGSDLVASIRKTSQSIVLEIVDIDAREVKWSSAGLDANSAAGGMGDDVHTEKAPEQEKEIQDVADPKETGEEEEESDSSPQHTDQPENTPNTEDVQEEEHGAVDRRLLSVPDGFLSIDDNGVLALYSVDTEIPVWKASTNAFAAGECTSVSAVSWGSQSTSSSMIFIAVGGAMFAATVVVMISRSRKGSAQKNGEGITLMFEEI